MAFLFLFSIGKEDQWEELLSLVYKNSNENLNLFSENKSELEQQKQKAFHYHPSLFFINVGSHKQSRLYLLEDLTNSTIIKS